MIQITDNTYTNHSGGAIGSDSYWSYIGDMYGVKSNHYWYGVRTPNGNYEISKDDFEEGCKHVLKANKTLNRKPYKYMNLLARNYMQVKNSDVIFAIGSISNGKVKGGTGWAVQMAIDDNKIVYVYDQFRKQWFINKDNKWDYYNETPSLTKNFAGIGTRNLNKDVRLAIASVYKQTFNNI